MSTSTVAKTDDGTITISILIPWADYQKKRKSFISSYAKTAVVKGFRKGKAPEDLVEKNLDESKVQEEILKDLIPEVYSQALQENNIRPAMLPKIHIHQIKKGEDIKIEAQTCEEPELDVDGYKDRIKSFTAKSKIVLPGQKEQKTPDIDEILKILVETVKTQIPEILLEQEVDRLLAQTLDEIKRLGLTLEQYLSSTGRTAENLRDEYRQKAEKDLKLEFALQKIASDEKISVSEQEVEEAIKNAKDENERKSLEQNRYLLASILRQQKTLDFLRNL